VSRVNRVRTRDLLLVGAHGLRSRRVRSLLSALGVAIGVATVVAVLGISRSSQQALISQLDALGTNLLVAKPSTAMGMGLDTSFPRTAVQQVKNIGPVDSVAQISDLSDTVVRSQLSDQMATKGVSVKAADPDLLDTIAGNLSAGRFLDNASGSYPTVVLGADAAKTLGITPAMLEGSMKPAVWIGGQNWTVVGILDPLPLASDLDLSVFVGYPAAKTYLDQDPTPSRLYIRARPEVVEKVADVLPAQINPEQPQNVETARPSDALAARVAAGNSYTSLFLGLGIVALLVGGVGTANVMVMSVLERRGEIGLRRALGATRGHVRLQFLVESLLLSLAGGVIGIAVGALVTGGFAVKQSTAFALPPTAVGYGFAAAVVIGVLAGVYPAMRASRLSPTEALRAG